MPWSLFLVPARPRKRLLIKSHATALRDYSVSSRILLVSALAAVMGVVAAVAAWILLEGIALATNLFYFHSWSFREDDPWQSGVHWWTAFNPILGGLIVGLIARFLSPKVRGHGLPEAVETIAFNGGKVQPRVAVLKPIATAISIGSGGPFGAEGPVIITGGAIGSVLGQLLPMTDSERTVLMVSGAVAGMTATFNCPMSAVLLAVEILLFEWRPRSLVPVAVACVTAGVARRLLPGLSSGALFEMDPTGVPMHHAVMLGALLIGVVAAFAAVFLSRSIHFFDTMFKKIPIHWMWYPAIGGVIVGLGGLLFPQSLGVGYSVITQLVSGESAWKLLIGILVVKSFIWVFSLGSNTAGGVLAPLLMIGAALGAAIGHGMPILDTGAWALVGMTSLLAAAIGAPLTSAMLALELTHDAGMLLPVLLGTVAAYGVSVLLQSRSLLTEGLSRRGFHLSREYGVDPLETVLVSQAMHTSVFALPATATRHDAAQWLAKMNEQGSDAWSHWQRLFPLLDADGKLSGLLTRTQMMKSAALPDLDQSLLNDASLDVVTVTPGDTLRAVADAMAESKLTHYPVTEADGRFAGIITIEDLLIARSREKLRDSERTRVLKMHWPFSAAQPVTAPATEAGEEIEALGGRGL